jgi:putative colanic acid biosysnthesis UDP-glucose lipid carrier transferase
LSRHLHYSRADQFFCAFAKLIDATLVAVSLGFFHRFYLGPGLQRGYMTAGLSVALATVIVGEFAGLYRPWAGESPKSETTRILGVWIVVVGAFLFGIYAIKMSTYFSRTTLFAWFFITPSVLVGWRYLGRWLVTHTLWTPQHARPALVWGTGDLGAAIARQIQCSPWLGVRLVDYLQYPHGDGDPLGQATDTAAAQLDRLESQVRNGEVEVLYLALPLVTSRFTRKIVERLADTTVSLYIVPDFFTTHLLHARWTSIGVIPVISLFETPFWGIHAWVKRVFDLVVASLILALVAVPMFAIAVAIKLSAPGPVLFKQRRYGLDGQEVQVWKFRTMRAADDGAVVPQATHDDPRVTRLGAMLRKTSLDELPQFINVLMGDMSIVGPRPHAVAHNEFYRKKIQGYMLRHKVRPGITGWAQINGWRGETDTLEKMEKRVQHDLWYIRNWSPWLDLKIIVLTIIRGFTGSNVY